MGISFMPLAHRFIVCLPTLLGCGQVGKALVFGTSYRRFESYHPSLFDK